MLLALFLGINWVTKIQVEPPHTCVRCVSLLTGWVQVSRQMLFAVPTVWREPKDLSSDCHSSVTKIKGIASKFTHTVKYQGDHGSAMVKMLCYKSVGRWFDPSWCQWKFH